MGGDASSKMLKTITSSLPALHESSYTVVDVKFETGQNPAMDAVANHLEDSNSFQQQHQEFGEEDEEEALQTPNSSPPQEAVNNKRKRSIPKKFSVDEDENPLHKVKSTTRKISIQSKISLRPIRELLQLYFLLKMEAL